MYTKIIALVASGLVAASAQAASKDHKPRGEGVGVGGGAVVGAIVGGPIGLVVGAATGGWLGDRFDRERRHRNRLESEVADAEARYEAASRLADSLETLVAGNEAEMEELKLVMRDQEDVYRNALRQAFDVEVYFRTGEADLSEIVADRIERLGQILLDFEDLSIVVEGHADPRGEEAYNDQLSAERAASVRDALIRAGLPSDKITTRATGEQQSQAAEGDLDAMALERRVDIGIVYPLPRENRVAQQ